MSFAKYEMHAELQAFFFLMFTRSFIQNNNNKNKKGIW